MTAGPGVTDTVTALSVRRKEIGQVPTKLETCFEEQGERTRFLVATDEPEYRERLLHMGYLRADDDRFATRWFVASAATRSYYERFATSIESMVLQSARRVPVPWQDALREVLGRLRGSGLIWWLYGSTALAVRGIEVEPGDIDINVSDCGRMGRIFDDLLVTPVERMDGWVARCGGRAFSHAIIEWISEPVAELDDRNAPHEQGPFIEPYLESVVWHGHLLRVPPLCAQLRVCNLRGLTERADLIREAIRFGPP
jgi:hypothetical protein